jgi:hypothetical protein
MRALTFAPGSVLQITGSERLHAASQIQIHQKKSIILVTVQGGPTSVKLHFGRLFPGAKPEKAEKIFVANF